MVSIQSSSYGVSALVSSQMPSATRNGESNPGQNKTSGVAETGSSQGVRAVDGAASSRPVLATSETEETADETDTAQTFVDTGETDNFAETEAPTWDEFEAAAKFLQDSIDLREEDEPAGNDSGISFDDAGTYRPAWIK